MLKTKPNSDGKEKAGYSFSFDWLMNLSIMLMVVGAVLFLFARANERRLEREHIRTLVEESCSKMGATHIDKDHGGCAFR